MDSDMNTTTTYMTTATWLGTDNDTDKSTIHALIIALACVSGLAILLFIVVIVCCWRKWKQAKAAARSVCCSTHYQALTFFLRKRDKHTVAMGPAADRL